MLGKYLASRVGEMSALTDATFLDTLINTKIPQIIAESAVAGDSSDWNLMELGILGDISISVTIFDNGNHTARHRTDYSFRTISGNLGLHVRRSAAQWQEPPASRPSGSHSA